MYRPFQKCNKRRMAFGSLSSPGWSVECIGENAEGRNVKKPCSCIVLPLLFWMQKHKRRLFAVNQFYTSWYKLATFNIWVFCYKLFAIFSHYMCGHFNVVSYFCVCCLILISCYSFTLAHQQLFGDFCLTYSCHIHSDIWIRSWERTNIRRPYCVYAYQFTFTHWCIFMSIIYRLSVIAWIAKVMGTFDYYQTKSQTYIKERWLVRLMPMSVRITPGAVLNVDKKYI